MTETYRKIRAIISGGGTGGHIFPAISIANKLMELNPDNSILFVGAEGRMEMEKMPAAGYRIVGLPVVGLQRQLSWENIRNDIRIPLKLARSLHRAGAIIEEFKPDVVIGVGGYASAPMLWKAAAKHIPTLIQEQNGFAGLTNRMLGKKAGCICVAYEGMERFFPADRIVISGNPIRSSIIAPDSRMKEEGIAHFGLTPGKRHLLVIGGSLGCSTLNRTLKAWIEDGLPGGDDVELIWQCGRVYKEGIDNFMQGRDLTGIRYSDFISRMDLAYAAADLVISRSGASSVSEICAAHKAAVFVPSPNVAEDHQTHNAMALVAKNAAVMVRDEDAGNGLMKTAMSLIHDTGKIEQMEKNAAELALPDAAQTIADEVYRLI